ncbi:hypothetical protein QYE76_011295 [Lolium multiflorum]|uniref:CCHC-type domain-containing protein n=1 Tax=Lolium multiflorum TaxID=4521 RepID=A0AAD8TYP8_LOLMU|nr:hypothetical protein QYE76_011295 [Lolium multiflorum]
MLPPHHPRRLPHHQVWARYGQNFSVRLAPEEPEAQRCRLDRPLGIGEESLLAPLCVVRRSRSMNDLEHRLRHAVVAYIGGDRSAVTCAQVGNALEAQLGIRANGCSIHPYQPEDFIIVLASEDLQSLEAELQKRFEHHDPCEMMRELKVIFETHAAVESYEASKQFFGCMMEEGSSVSEHVFAMSGHAKKLSDLGIVIPNQLGIHRVLQSLPPSYKNFVMNYNMQNMNKELPELFSMLKSAEVEIRKENQVLMVNKTTSFKKQGKPNKGNFKKGGKKVAAPPEKPKAGPKPETVCYYCQGKGHWKRNCSKYLADLKSGHKRRKEFLTKEVTGRKVELDEVDEPSLIDQSSAVPEEVPAPIGEEANDDDHETSNEEATTSQIDEGTPLLIGIIPVRMS